MKEIALILIMLSVLLTTAFSVGAAYERQAISKKSVNTCAPEKRP